VRDRHHARRVGAFSSGARLATSEGMREQGIAFCTHLARAGKRLALAVCALFAGASSLAQAFPSAGTTGFVLDGNRIYARLAFVRPDGSVHQALASVDMGSASMGIARSLLEELHLDESKRLLFRVGELSVEVPAGEVISRSGEPYSIGSDLKVEALLPAGVLQNFQVVIDYGSRTLTLARSPSHKPEGVSVPLHINRQTGLVAVDATIAGKPCAVTIDNGSAYTWFRQSTAKDWLRSHPEWERGLGAVGASNMRMAGDGGEASGTLLRIPEISLGPVRLRDVGVLAPGPGGEFPGGLDLFDWYSSKNALPVIGWVGGNVLKQFRLTIDYPNQRIYWLRETDPDSHDLDQVGLTLRAEGGEYVVATVATKNGKPTVENVSPGDKLIRVGELETKHATWGGIYEALHGKPGEIRVLLIERNGDRITVRVRVTAF